MPKALITTASGSTVAIEGTQEEVATLLARFSEGEQFTDPLSGAVRAQSRRRTKPTPMGLLSELIAEGFFGEPKELGAVRIALKEKGHFYPVTTLSPLMLRLVRRKDLRRIKDRKRWTYVA